jgi:hypothetical protein
MIYLKRVFRRGFVIDDASSTLLYTIRPPSTSMTATTTEGLLPLLLQI